MDRAALYILLRSWARLLGTFMIGMSGARGLTSAGGDGELIHVVDYVPVYRGDAPLYRVRTFGQLFEARHQDLRVVGIYSRVVLIHPIALLVIHLYRVKRSLYRLGELEPHLIGGLGQDIPVCGGCLYQLRVGQSGTA